MYTVLPRSILLVTLPRRPKKVTRTISSRRSLLFLRRTKPPRLSICRRRRSCSRILAMLSFVSPSVDVFNVAMNSFVGGCACLCFALAFVPLLTFDESNESQTQEDDLEDATKSPSFTNVRSFQSCLNLTVEREAQTEPNFFEEIKRRERRSGVSPSSVMKTMSAYIKKQMPLDDYSSTSMSKAQCKGRGKTQSSMTEVMDMERNIGRNEMEAVEELARLEKQFWDTTAANTRTGTTTTNEAATLSTTRARNTMTKTKVKEC
eukprot:g6249.t1